MTKKRNFISAWTVLSAIAMLMFFSGCAKEETPDKSTVYNLKVKDVLGISGTVTFTETSSTVATVDIKLFGAPSGSHPVVLNMYSTVETGPVVLVLNPVDASGNSSTAITEKTYAQLLSFDGCIRILQSTTKPNVILAQTDIGGNEITTSNKTFELTSVGESGVSGSVLFEKRVNGNTLVTILLTGPISGEMYPATINLGSIASVGGGPVSITLNNVDGSNGKSYTNIRELNSGIEISYDNWLVYDGYLNIYQNSVSLDNVICHGNLGSN